jgi:hypothetical protein
MSDRADYNAAQLERFLGMSPQELMADGSSAAFRALPQNRIGIGGYEGLRPASAGTTIWDQLFPSTPLQFSNRDPDGGVEQYGFTNPFTAPNGQTYYADSNYPAQTAAGIVSQYGSEPLWVNSQGNPTQFFLDDSGQMMYRFPGWGQGSFNDPRWGEYVPASAYEQWAANQQGTWDKLGGFLPALFASILGAGPIAASMGAYGGASAAGAAGGLEGAAQAFPLIGDGMYSVAPLAADGTVGAATTMGAGAAGAGTVMGGSGLMEAGFLGAEGMGTGAATTAGGVGAAGLAGQAAAGAGSSLASQAAGGAASSGGFWDGILKTGKIAGMDLGAAGMALASYFAQKEHADELQRIAQESAARSDPAAGLRPYFQQETLKSFSDPNYFKNDSTLGGLSRLATDEVQRNMSARGWNMSGNEAQALGSRLQDESMKYAQQQQSMLGQFAGLTANPSYAGLNFGNLASQGSQQDLRALGNLGVLGNEVSKAIPSIADAFKGAFNSGGLV